MNFSSRSNTPVIHFLFFAARLRDLSNASCQIQPQQWCNFTLFRFLDQCVQCVVRSFYWLLLLLSSSYSCSPKRWRASLQTIRQTPTKKSGGQPDRPSRQRRRPRENRSHTDDDNDGTDTDTLGALIKRQRPERSNARVLYITIS